MASTAKTHHTQSRKLHNLSSSFRTHTLITGTLNHKFTIKHVPSAVSSVCHLLVFDAAAVVQFSATLYVRHKKNNFFFLNILFLESEFRFNRSLHLELFSTIQRNINFHQNHTTENAQHGVNKRKIAQNSSWEKISP